MRDDLLIRVAHSVEPESFGSTTEAWAAAMNAAWDGDVDTPEVLEVQQAAASAGAWNAVYMLSAVAGLETSVLIDAEGSVFIDWGSPGLVPLRAHVGAGVLELNVTRDGDAVVGDGGVVVDHAAVVEVVAGRCV